MADKKTSRNTAVEKDKSKKKGGWPKTAFICAIIVVLFSVLFNYCGSTKESSSSQEEPSIERRHAKDKASENYEPNASSVVDNIPYVETYIKYHLVLPNYVPNTPNLVVRRGYKFAYETDNPCKFVNPATGKTIDWTPGEQGYEKFGDNLRWQVYSVNQPCTLTVYIPGRSSHD